MLTESKEQAVVVTTLSLSRSLGSILGVAWSSFILQNALLAYLPKFVTGDAATKAHIIERVRSSVRAINTLDPIHRDEGKQKDPNKVKLTWLQ